MTTLNENFNTFLPLNRKEKFFTGTVLPQIICYQNFEYLQRFFDLIPNFNRRIPIKPNASENNILFLTEYSFKESLVEQFFIEKYGSSFETKDTPDLAILITEPEQILIVAEAKMYSSITPGDLSIQMNNQKWFVDAVQKTNNIIEKNIFHFGIVPQKLIPLKASINHPLIYWEEILASFEGILGDNYFLSTLKLAIEKFDDLKSSNSGGISSFGKNMTMKLSGEKIVELHHSGTTFIVGRSGGLYGEKLKTDIQTGGWRSFEYEINEQLISPVNKNWFTSTQFVVLASNSEKPTQEKHNSNENYLSTRRIDDWHFSHLGRDYFLDIAAKIGFGRSMDVPIYRVYIGKSGVPYSEKKRGRNVNPNWSVITSDEREFKCGTTTGNIIEPGLFNRKNCHVFDWGEIKSFFEQQLRPR